MAQWVKDPVLSLRGLGSLLWVGFDPWPSNLHMPHAWPKKKRSPYCFLMNVGFWVLLYCGY